MHDAIDIDSNALLSLASITGFETVFISFVRFGCGLGRHRAQRGRLRSDVTTIGFGDDPEVNVAVDDIASGTAIAIQDGDTGDGDGDWTNDLTLGVNQTADATLNLVIKTDGSRSTP